MFHCDLLRGMYPLLCATKREGQVSSNDPFKAGLQRADDKRRGVQEQRKKLIDLFASEKARLERIARQVGGRREASGYAFKIFGGAVAQMDTYFDSEGVSPPTLTICYEKSVKKNYDGKTEVVDGNGVSTIYAGYYDYGKGYTPQEDSTILEGIGYTLATNQVRLSENNKAVQEANTGCLVFIAVPLLVGLGSTFARWIT